MVVVFLLKGTWPLVVLATIFSAPPRPTIGTISFHMVLSDVSYSVPESKSKEPLKEKEESDESSSHVEVPLLELEELDVVVLEMAEVEDIAAKMVHNQDP